MGLLRFRVLPLFVIIAMIFITACSPQEEDAGSPIEFTGDVTAINGDTITVGGFSVDISNASTPIDGFDIGDEVRVTGLADGTDITAVVVALVDETDDDDDAQVDATEIDPTATDAPTDNASPTDVAPTAVPDDPTVEPTTSDTTSPTDDTPDIVIDGDPILVIEGPVQEININSITIFDIDIQVDPADPILTEIRIGDTIRVEGESSFEGTTIIIVAINITVIETTVIVINNPVYIAPGLPANCRQTRRGRVTCRGSSRRSSR